MPNHPTLVLVCKRPALGHGKQRLAGRIGAGPALAIAEGLLDCALEDLADWPGPTVIAPDRPDACAWAASRAPGALCLAQASGNLGERLNALDRTLRELGHAQLVFIGSDAPALTRDDYRQVPPALAESDTLLLGARDGGVVLMASNRPWPDLAALPWSSDRLAAALAAACRVAGHRLAYGRESFDIDEQADLPAARQALADDPRPARQCLLRQIHPHSGAQP